MSFQAILFYLFAAILVFAALRVVTTRNPVHAGAVMVLFLFVVMMLDVNFDSLRAQFRNYVPVAAAVGVLVLVEMALVLLGSYLKPGTAAAPAPARGGNTRALGLQLYTDYVYAPSCCWSRSSRRSRSPTGAGARRATRTRASR